AAPEVGALVGTVGTPPEPPSVATSARPTPAPSRSSTITAAMTTFLTERRARGLGGRRTAVGSASARGARMAVAADSPASAAASAAPDEVDDALGFERQPARQHLGEDDAERV